MANATTPAMIPIKTPVPSPCLLLSSAISTIQFINVQHTVKHSLLGMGMERVSTLLKLLLPIALDALKLTLVDSPGGISFTKSYVSSVKERLTFSLNITGASLVKYNYNN